jgi:hypothetical protein
MLRVIYAECHYAKCRYDECRYAECRGAFSREHLMFNRVTSVDFASPIHDTLFSL